MVADESSMNSSSMMGFLDVAGLFSTVGLSSMMGLSCMVDSSSRMGFSSMVGLVWCFLWCSQEIKGLGLSRGWALGWKAHEILGPTVC